MGTVTAQTESIAIGHTVVRFLVAIYTIASATGVIFGTNLSLLLTPFMAEWTAQGAITLLVSLLCFAMLVGYKRRAMALCLALIFLWSSYFAILGPNAQVVGGSHWRDMMLIAALLLIYADAAHEDENDLSTLARFLRQPRSIAGTVAHSNKAPGPNAMKARRTSQTLFHNDLHEYGNR